MKTELKIQLLRAISVYSSFLKKDEHSCLGVRIGNCIDSALCYFLECLEREGVLDRLEEEFFVLLSRRDFLEREKEELLDIVFDVEEISECIQGFMRDANIIGEVDRSSFRYEAAYAGQEKVPVWMMDVQLCPPTSYCKRRVRVVVEAARLEVILMVTIQEN